MLKEPDESKRIEIIFRSSGLKSITAFARTLGLSRGENIYQIIRGNNGISKALALKINQVYPAFSLSWVMFGEEPQQTPQRMKIPVYSNLQNFIDKKEANIPLMVEEQLIPSGAIGAISISEECPFKNLAGNLVFITDAGNTLLKAKKFYIILDGGYPVIVQGMKRENLVVAFDGAREIIHFTHIYNPCYQITGMLRPSPNLY